MTKSKNMALRPTSNDQILIDHCRKLIEANSDINSISNTDLLRLALEYYCSMLSEKYNSYPSKE